MKRNWQIRFPNNKNEIPNAVIDYIAKQLNIDSKIFDGYDLNKRSYFYHKSQIREYFGFREATAADGDKVKDFLIENILYLEMNYERLKVEALNKFKLLHIEPPTIDRLERIIKSAIHTYEIKFFKETYSKSPTSSVDKMDT
ncbi:DUF4158 domain-containing protein [Crassaminicella indica]|uniref:DUF4158 domain-containing protein n=1 Tax=Crassaminicella indica TaxID=2855394 RepID=A0ABX8R8W3_9CLOT|nr:DUF4158 domain-containing protein [Crassaminicella indica]QXM05498.1 DUF4158 domain-containing protein [Crassaminicella indica]